MRAGEGAKGAQVRGNDLNDFVYAGASVRQSDPSGSFFVNKRDTMGAIWSRCPQPAWGCAFPTHLVPRAFGRVEMDGHLVPIDTGDQKTSSNIVRSLRT